MRYIIFALLAGMISAGSAEKDYLFAIIPGVKVGVEFGKQVKIVPGLEVSFVTGRSDYDVLGGIVFGMQPGLRYLEAELMSSRDQIIYGGAIGVEKAGPAYFSRCRIFGGDLIFASFTLPLGLRRCETDMVLKFPLITNARVFW